MPRFPVLTLIACVCVVIGFVQPAHAQEALPYQTPPAELLALVDAAPAPATSISPDGSWILIIGRPSLPGLIELAQPEIGLGGIRINPLTTGPSRSTPSNSLAFLASTPGAVERPIHGLPENPRIRNVSWSPTGDRIAFTLDVDNEILLYLADTETATARQASSRALNNVAGMPYQWLPTGELLLRAIPADRGSAPEGPLVPVGPVIQESSGIAAPVRTIQNLLQNPHDEDLFDYYFESELVRLDLNGQEQGLGIRGLITGITRSPNGEYLLIYQVHRPFSYTVPYNRFPTRVAVYNADTGAYQATIAELPLAEHIPTGFGSVATGPRSISWRTNAPSTLVWAEALDGGDIRAAADFRDRIFMLDAPFTSAPRALMDTELRYIGIWWTDAGYGLLRESLWQTRIEKTYEIHPDDPQSEPRLVMEISTEDSYNDPGSPVTELDEATGYQLIRTTNNGRSLFFRGTGASPEGNRPFLRIMNLDSGETTELFRSEAPYHESILNLLDIENNLVLMQRQSPTEPPSLFLRNLVTGDLTQLTHTPHPYPEFADITREPIEYHRADGVPLSAILYLPAGYDAERDGPLPTLIWAYPREFRSGDTAGQRSDSPYQFNYISYWGAVAYATRGYAVLDNAGIPIVGEGDEEPNDTFVEQLVAGAQAAIDEGVRRGVVDPNRVAVGGHSYGAFMAANLLAHSDLFKAAIARSGAYNRTLTPFGFQYEERTYWEAPEVYNSMSPFMHAEKITAPILIIHGQADDNSGTFPIQSERLYGAINGHGGTARLVMLPYESHGYSSRESILHMLWETDRFLEMHVRNPDVE